MTKCPYRTIHHTPLDALSCDLPMPPPLKSFRHLWFLFIFSIIFRNYSYQIYFHQNLHNWTSLNDQGMCQTPSLIISF